MPAKKSAKKAAPKAAAKKPVAKAKPAAKKAAKPAAKKAAPAKPVKKAEKHTVAKREAVAAKSGKRAAPKAVAPKAAAKPAVKTKPKASKAKKPTTGKAARNSETRLMWAPQPVENARWYVAQTASNYEKRVQTLIREQVLLQGMQRFVEDVLIPTEPVVEIKKGVKVSTDRKFFPGYVLIKCNLTDDVWHLIRYTPHVTGFLGSERGKKPFPITETEAQRILNVIEHGAEKPRSLVAFEVGEAVRVTEGPFANFQGSVEMVDEEKERLTVTVSIFGRATPIELDYNQVEKA
jgi:transcriptional antiterminator NusG